MKDIIAFILSFTFYGFLAMIVGPFYLPVFLVLCFIRMIHEYQKKQTISENKKSEAPILEGEIISQTETIKPKTLEEEILKRYR